MNWRWISLSALLAALVIGYGAFTRRGGSPEFVSSAPSRPGYYLKNAVITETQPNGSLSTQLAAARIEQEPISNDISMTDVQLNYFQSSDQEWRLTANRGFMAGESPIVELFGNVQLRPAAPGSEDVLRTEALAIDTKKNLAYSTRSPVRIRYGQHSLLVDSFTFDMSTEQIHMESIQGRYATP